MKYALLGSIVLFLCSCDKGEQSPVTTTAIIDTGAVIVCDYIELDKIDRISRFRSAYGHDYSDAFEQCRSMKHYYQPKDTVNWGSIKIFSPVNGTVVWLYEEWAGTQVQISPTQHPLHRINIFHVALQRPLTIGETVTAGQQLGTHIGSQTMSDIAVEYSVQDKRKLVSYFDVMPDSVFQKYVARGIANRSDCIISKEARDADPLNCNGDTFVKGGSLMDWVVLH